MKKTTKKNPFPEQIFVQSFHDDYPDDQYFSADSELPMPNDNEKVAVYKLVSVKTLKVTRELV